MVGGMICFNNGAYFVTTAAISWDRCKQDINSHMGSGCDKLEVIPGFSDLYGNAWGSPKTQDVFTGRVVMIYKGR